MKYIYDNNGVYITTTYDYIEDETILNAYENCIITNTKYIVPVIENDKLIETYNNKMTVIFDKDKNILEIENGEHRNIENSKVFDFDNNVIENKKYYTLNENLELVFNEELKNKDMEEENKRVLTLKQDELKLVANELKQGFWNYGFIFKDNLRQPCREQDKTAIIAGIVGFSAMGIKHLKWKFFEKDTGKHIYVNLTLNELTYLAGMIKALTEIGMITESTIINEIENITSLEELEKYDVKKVFDNLVKLGIEKAKKELASVGK